MFSPGQIKNENSYTLSLFYYLRGFVLFFDISTWWNISDFSIIGLWPTEKNTKRIMFQVVYKVTQ